MGYYLNKQIELYKRQRELKPIIDSMLNDKSMPRYESSYSLYNRLKDGILPYSGGWLEQPQWYIEDMNYISLLREYESLPYMMARNSERIREINKRGAR